jgi:hypothetical protein
MGGEWEILNRQTLVEDLKRAFDPHSAEVLADVLGRVVDRVASFITLHEDVRGLKEVVEQLVQAQARSEERITRLEMAVERLEGAVEQLAQAQARSEERITRLEAAVERLAQAQARTEQALQQLAKQVGGLSDTVGGDIEDIAYIVVHDVLEREYGWQVGVLERTWQRWDESEEEVNLFGEATDPARPDRKIWIVGEAKHNLTLREVERFALQVDRARRHLKGEIFPVCFCYRARPEVQRRVRSEGIYMVFSYGKLVPPDAHREVGRTHG